MAKPKTPKPGTAVATIIPPHKFQPGNPGKQPGTTTKTTRAVKEMILTALEQAGGESYLVYHAMVNPQLFFPILGKVIPLQVGSDPDAPLNVVHHYIERKSVPSPNKKK